MSDKFFFKGRQDARVNHVKCGYKEKGAQKVGTKKFPLSLVVTSEERKEEVAALVAGANLYADIRIDENEGAVESIDALTVLLNKTVTSVKQEAVPSRNDPCSCGSGKKYKKCCG
ncbi:PBPRA1643 family SWIM/SEC-C metal-binding motif protein [Parendozoicomonas haliclonae]|uniref:Preprotein translocase subunit SecA n=1 Tax=Parendozoicomonas haliclonae TaxID=1960125 RepID=A0A1X7ANU2_9GAMM|nr:PBPRA1643 family SWIM/SEC-C metal-binding motif protein [Parendozoicomonas haliclonae]SMA49760.1 hypothetical protein EHSB41UT_03549 [Parendozoicomonas haliclonae]